jgi:hypothetical protein
MPRYDKKNGRLEVLSAIFTSFTSQEPVNDRDKGLAQNGCVPPTFPRPAPVEPVPLDLLVMRRKDRKW